MVQNLFLDVIRVSLTTSIVIAVLLLLLPLIHKNYTAKWRYFVWLILAVRLLIPFSPSLPQTPIEITPASQDITFKVPVQNTASSPLVNQAAAPETTKASAVSAVPSVPLVSRTITLNEILSIVWASGIALFMLFHLIGYFIFKKSALRFSKPIEDQHTAELWSEVKEEMVISRNIRLLACKKVQSPMMTGFFRPLLLLPDLDYSDADLKLILKHELIHYMRRDIWYKLLMVCANAVHWFNPLVYLMTAMSNRDIEMACDSELIKDSDSSFRKQYSETILSAIHKGNQRQTAFSTYFYGGKKTMKERFANIFDMNKKRKGFIALCAVIIVIGISGASVAYGVDDSKAGQTIDNIALLKAGNSYDLEDGKFVISYGTKKSAVVPLAPDTGDQSTYFADKAVYISDAVTAVAYSDSTDPASPVTVLISNDEGKTWNSYSAVNTKVDSYQQKYMGFTNQNDGWLLLAGGVAMGHQENRIFQTSDGGKTWHEIGNTNDVYTRIVTGAGFANKNIGFVSFRYDTDVNPVVYRTEDKGKTWEKCSLEIPDSFKSIATYATALSPVFNGAKGVLPVTFRNNETNSDPVNVNVQYETSDYGKTWNLNEKATEIAKSIVINTNRIQLQDMANQWGEAVKNRDGKAQYDLMSTELQKRVYEDYQQRNWVTGQSSPWVDGFTVKPDDNTAVVTYTYMTSDGFAGYYLQTLSFAVENGQLTISDYTEPKQVNGQSRGTVLAYMDKGKTWLSAANLYEGMFSDMTLSIDGKTKRFPWKTYGEPAFLPELSYADVDGDGQNELIVILCESEGTGQLVEQIHVLNPKDFSEITVQSPLTALENRVVSKIDESGIKITIDNQNALVFPEKEITAKVAEKKSWFDNLATGSIIDYSMQGNSVVVEVAAQLLPAGFLGSFNLTYEYKDHQLKVSGISFSSDI